ncbi:alpha/beta fold hydrolase [Salinarimonas soli]|uniref:Alpha/beta hydrolase n=1 Tax=Salinarimonas soli TaxID=1638099 RepID=A0A5B2VB06_9HYPH|nr:alpha/beta hydrolase [Salinarimonas soli]KAA2235795.1 alpha/beta hydrolase [Salinarimonas soli]
MHSLHAHRVAIGDESVPLADVGTGAPVLLLHGAGTDLRVWGPHASQLSAHVRCLAPTQRYHGTQGWRGDGPAYGVGTHAADLNALVDALGVAPVTVVAWSYAGHVALHAAGRRPDQFARLVLFEPGVRTLALDEAEGLPVARDSQAMFGPIVEAVRGGDPVQAMRALIDGSGGAGYFDALGPERRSVYLDNAHTLPLLLAQEEPPPASREALSRLSMPVHVLWGGISRPCAGLPARALARCWPAGAHREIPGAGHLWPEEAPEAFCAAILEAMG